MIAAGRRTAPNRRAGNSAAPSSAARRAGCCRPRWCSASSAPRWCSTRSPGPRFARRRGAVAAVAAQPELTAGRAASGHARHAAVQRDRPDLTAAAGVPRQPVRSPRLAAWLWWHTFCPAWPRARARHGAGAAGLAGRRCDAVLAALALGRCCWASTCAARVAYPGVVLRLGTLAALQPCSASCRRRWSRWLGRPWLDAGAARGLHLVDSAFGVMGLLAFGPESLHPAADVRASRRAERAATNSPPAPCPCSRLTAMTAASRWHAGSDFAAPAAAPRRAVRRRLALRLKSAADAPPRSHRHRHARRDLGRGLRLMQRSAGRASA